MSIWSVTCSDYGSNPDSGLLFSGAILSNLGGFGPFPLVVGEEIGNEVHGADLDLLK